MERVLIPKRAVLRVLSTMVLMLTVFAFAPQSADAQYGGVSGLFVTTSPTNPGFADFSGLGCQGGQEVVLYFPGLQATSGDPSATESVPGRILAVTTAASSPDALLNGTFKFPNVRLPTDVEPGVYEVHARCGDLDLRVVIQIDSDGLITINPDPDTPITNETPDSGIPGSLPFTGGDPSRAVSLGAGVIAAGLSFMALSRRQQRV
jgi:hypothetical protein